MDAAARPCGGKAARCGRCARTLGVLGAGVEQASGSVPMQDFVWPCKAVLLLGNEQEGVPATLLPLLDACVEIPMVGLTRSLNAHVSGAVACWQWLVTSRLRAA